MRHVPTSEEARKPLDEYSEGLIGLGLLGGEFASYAASELLSHNSCYGSVRYWMLKSCFGRRDRITPRIYIHDWKWMDRRPKASVSKFTPGDHYYALDQKFHSLEEAQEYLSSRGYQYEGFVEKHVYREE